MKDLRSFLGLANYYRIFIVGYSKKASTLTYLSKNDVKSVWSVRCEEAFQNMKEAIASEPIFKLHVFELPFQVHNDVTHKVIGGVLVKQVHLVIQLMQKRWLLLYIACRLRGYTSWVLSLW
ncbi:hypothetical protein MTR67_001383 [Solanum verrucosum]|uniref:Reverse transcriptase/retrotransposon-derived protein RNase H-like domain-containing protein n=1 Tax=Solanum verrucosum TaxID=315347 RepID=A0AAF0PNG7_SOLVR|nr:hypothetical protein MTR67_001383 [Solanum verrucosum]